MKKIMLTLSMAAALAVVHDQALAQTDKRVSEAKENDKSAEEIWNDQRDWEDWPAAEEAEKPVATETVSDSAVSSPAVAAEPEPVKAAPASTPAAAPAETRVANAGGAASYDLTSINAKRVARLQKKYNGTVNKPKGKAYNHKNYRPPKKR